MKNLFISLLLLSVIIFSAGAAFASDDVDIISVDNEINADDVVAIEDEAIVISENDDSIVSEASNDVEILKENSTNVVTKDTFNNFFDDTGVLLSNVTSDELTFEGTFEGINITSITINRTINLKGNDAVLNNISLVIGADDVTVTGFTINQENEFAGILIGGTNVNIADNTINFKTIDGFDGYAIYAEDSANLKLINNVISYVGTTTGYGVNNAIRVTGSNGSEIKGNKLNITIPSSAVGWAEQPPGSGNWVSSPVSEGVVIKDSTGVNFADNEVTLDYNNIVGSYDTIYVVDVACDDAVLSGNTITADGATYVYGIIITGQNFNIVKNNLNISSDVYYANGIDVEGPASGIIDDNNILVSSVGTAYPVYAGMNYQPASVNITNNVLTADAYFVCGIELGGNTHIIKNNTITATGNYSIAIGSGAQNIIVEDNTLSSIASNVGNESIWDSVGVETAGIKVNLGNATINNNVISGNAKGVVLKGNSISLTNNNITIDAEDGIEAYGVYADSVSQLSVEDNSIQFTGNSDGYVVNNALYVISSNNANIKGNKFNITIPSASVAWFEVPPSSGNWVSSPVIEGVVIKDSTGVNFADNGVTLDYNNIIGSYDTIYVVDVACDDAVLSGNTITANGANYVYGIIITGQNFTIENNNLNITSELNYANGIDVEGPATGIVNDNIIIITSKATAYPIYAGMNDQPVSANYTGNTIYANAYFVCGIELGGDTHIVKNNNIAVEGNYTIGIGSGASDVILENNAIVAVGTNVGNEPIWDSVGVETAAIKINLGNANMTDNLITSNAKGVVLKGDSIILNNNTINVAAEEAIEAYGVYADSVSTLSIEDNYIGFVGKTDGSVVNNALYVDSSDNAAVKSNTFEIIIPSAPSNWSEQPPSSGNWVSSPTTDGIAIKSSKALNFTGNNVKLNYNDIVGMYDTIHVVNIDSDDAVVSDNTIDALGASYIYGIMISGQNFAIENNKLNIASNVSYANGIDVEGPASGIINNNDIVISSIDTAYPVYAGMNYQPASVNITNNVLTADAYFVCGIELGGNTHIVKNNTITFTDANYTIAIGSGAENILVEDNVIIALGSNVGDLPIWDSVGVETAGIKVNLGEASIINNRVITNGEYSVKLAETKSSVHDNYLVADKLNGDKSVNATDDAEVYNNTPTLKSVLSAADLVIENGKIGKYVAILKDEDNNPIANQNVSVVIGNETLTNVTDEKGNVVFIINLTKGNYTVVAAYEGLGNYAPVSSDNTVTVIDPIKKDTVINVVAKFSRDANDYKAGEKGGFFYAYLYDADGKPLANKTVQIAVNGPIYNVTTDAKGRAGLQVNLAAANTYTYAISFQGDDEYNAAPLASTKLTLTAKKTSITASSKTFKAKAKTKTISVTLKTIKNKYDGKTYLSKGKKLTLKINGKTYTAKTNAKGVAKFSIKLTKKGKFTAKIKFAGDKTYKASSKSIKVTIK